MRSRRSSTPIRCRAHIAVVWSGLFNFLGVLASSGAVAYGIIALLPVELILKVGSASGFAMVFALLIGAIIWNLGTWYLGLPASSSHTLIGSIIGVGLANQLMAGIGASGVDWAQAAQGRLLAAVLAAHRLLRGRPAAAHAEAGRAQPALYAEPKGGEPPPWWIRGVLILTCTGVSFAHGSNDGQKGMGLIMLILIGVVPTAYALNRAMPDSHSQPFLRCRPTSRRRSTATAMAIPRPIRARSRARTCARVSRSRRSCRRSPRSCAASRRRCSSTDRCACLPAAAVQNVRNDMYLASETIRHLGANATPHFEPAGCAAPGSSYRSELNGATRFIPTWVKIAVAIALGLGTMVGWKRIVVTVGEKIGKTI